MSSRGVLVDTGAWLAVLHRRDQYHEGAAALLRQLRSQRAPLLVTDLILAELHLHLVRGIGPRGAAEHVETLTSDPLVEEVFTTRDLQASALASWIHRFQDQPFTLTDAVSFALMQARRIPAAFTFDRHFRVAGFRTLP